MHSCGKIRVDEEELKEILRKVVIFARQRITIFEKSPMGILIVNKDGLVLDANPAVIRNLREDPVGRSIFDMLPNDFAERALKAVRESIERDETLTFQDTMNLRHYILHFNPCRPFDGEMYCLVMILDITRIVRMQRMMDIARRIGSTILHAKEKEDMLRGVAEILSEPEEFSAVVMRSGDLEITAGGGRSGREYTFQMEFGSEKVGSVSIWSVRELDEAEISLLQTIVSDVGLAAKLMDMRLQLERNIVQIAYLVDGIRNPLTAIQLNAELYADNTLRENLLEQVEKIKNSVSKLDSCWRESEKILRILRL